MRILLIGGNGFIGSPLTKKLLESGHELALFHRRPQVPAAKRVLNIQGDRNRLADYSAQIEQFSPDFIIDLILSSGEQARQLMRVANGIVARVIALSSMDVYRAWGIVQEREQGPLELLPITEESPLRTARNLYPAETIKMMQNSFSWLDEDYDKIAVEDEIMGSHAVSGTVIRLPMVFGPGDPLHRFFPLLKRHADRRSSILFADDLAAWRGPRGYVENVAHAIALAAISDRARRRIYNVCQEPTFTELEWQKKIAERLNWEAKFVVLPKEETPKHLLQPGNAAQHLVVSSERIRSELGFEEPVELNEAIRRTIAWEQKNPPSRINSQQFDYDAEDAALAAHV